MFKKIGFESKLDPHIDIITCFCSCACSGTVLVTVGMYALNYTEVHEYIDPRADPGPDGW